MKSSYKPTSILGCYSQVNRKALYINYGKPQVLITLRGLPFSTAVWTAKGRKSV